MRPRGRAWARAVCVLACVLAARAAFVVETGSLSIESPAGLGPYDISLANFGQSIYGGSLRGQLLYQRDPASSYGCAPFTTPFATSPNAGSGLNAIAVINRGGPPGQAACAFTTKALNAQNAGAKAVLIVDNRAESLITMDAGADDDSQRDEALITVPCALVTQAVGEALKARILLGTLLVGSMSWADVVPRSAPVVAWEFWTNSNDECGVKCDNQKAFMQALAPEVSPLLQARAMTFTPHYITLQCGPYADQAYCQKQCINNGRYCQQDPDGDLESGYSGRDVVLENLRSLCVFQAFNQSGTPWLWWSYVTQVGSACSMRGASYSPDCAANIARNLGVSDAAVTACMGSADADAPNALLDAEQGGMRSSGRRGDITLFPTLIANGVQFRGDLAMDTVMEFLCAGYPANGAPARCTQGGVVSLPCADGHFGALQCAAHAAPAGDGTTRCVEQSQYPYWQCVCPMGSTYTSGADGTASCVASNACLTRAAGIALCNCPTCLCQTLAAGSAVPFRCSNVTVDECAGYNGGCWQGDLAGKHFTACMPDLSAKRAAGLAGVDPASVRGYTCTCPRGFAGDGAVACHDVNECDANPCPGAHMACINSPGSYACACTPGFAMDVASMTCVPAATSPGGRGGGSGGLSGGAVFGVVLLTLGSAGAAGYGLYRWRLKKHMSDEIRSIMSNYLPLGTPDDDFRPLAGGEEEAATAI